MPQLSLSDGLLQVPGIQATGVHAGLKSGGRPDVAIIHSLSERTTCAAVFTQNAFAAAPVHLSRQHVADGDIRAIVVNSANANACTGRQGLRDALEMARTTAACLGLDEKQVLVCSTGRIGVPMPIEKVLSGITKAAAELPDAVGGEVAQAILTTDSGPKQASTTFTIEGHTLQIAGISKGAGMIHPNMATMLGFIATDATIPASDLRAAMQFVTQRSFNQISVDGDESTNDTAVILATGATDAPVLTQDHADWPAFLDALLAVTQSLAKQIAADGEGATRLLHVEVLGAASDAEARMAARAVAKSNLVKSAIHGSDPNWGRIVSAMGSTRAQIDPQVVDIDVGNLRQTVSVLQDGQPLDVEAQARELLSAPEVLLRIHLHQAQGQGTAWGCDLTPDYVVFNSAYTT